MKQQLWVRTRTDRYELVWECDEKMDEESARKASEEAMKPYDWRHAVYRRHNEIGWYEWTQLGQYYLRSKPNDGYTYTWYFHYPDYSPETPEENEEYWALMQQWKNECPDTYYRENELPAIA